jgi:hypothetical protein
MARGRLRVQILDGGKLAGHVRLQHGGSSRAGTALAAMLQIVIVLYSMQRPPVPP